MSNYNIIYKKILNIPAEVQISKTGKDPDGSKQYVSRPNRRYNTIQNIFEISEADKELFTTAFKNVCNGKGNEATRITTLHSSSLLGLLAFFRVPNHPISIRGLEGIIFDKIYFEVESNVFGSNSSVDVMLVSEEENTLLFLELKFTELLSLSKHYWIDRKYKNVYSSLSTILSKADILVGPIVPRKHDSRNKNILSYSTEEFKISSLSNSKHYFGGIKQMISHAIGLMKSPLSGDKNKELKERYLVGKAPRIILATMLYNPSEHDSSFRDAYDDYARLYCQVFSQSVAIKEQLMKFEGFENNIEILDRPLTYQQDIVCVNGENPFIPKVRQIYRL